MVLNFQQNDAPMSSEMNLGLKIKELMKKQNVSIEYVANRIGYTSQGFGKILKKSDFNTELLRKICEGLGVDMHELFISDHSVTQKGNANIGGSGNIQYKGENNTIGQTEGKEQSLLNEIERLKNQVTSLKEQNDLLREMVEILKAKT